MSGNVTGGWESQLTRTASAVFEKSSSENFNQKAFVTPRFAWCRAIPADGRALPIYELTALPLTKKVLDSICALPVSSMQNYRPQTGPDQK